MPSQCFDVLGAIMDFIFPDICMFNGFHRICLYVRPSVVFHVCVHIIAGSVHIAFIIL